MTVEVSTKDLDEAALFWCQDGAAFVGADPVARKGKGGLTVFFRIKVAVENEDAVRQLRRDYYNGKTLVDPRLFSSRQNDLRNILFAALRKDGAR